MSRPVFSADDVRAARRRGETRLPVPSGAIVTPLAREEAGRSGIELVEEAGTGGRPGSAPAAPSPSAAGHVPTCDPDDLERVVERVRDRVPGVDPAQVREIARRVLEREGG